MTASGAPAHAAPAAFLLGERSAHVWRVPLRGGNHHELLRALSPDERAKAGRFVRERDAQGFVVAHGALRRVLAGYQSTSPDRLQFTAGAFGKPSLVALPDTPVLEFNLSHSGDMALIAVARGGPVGVDVEQWDRQIEHIELAEHFFSTSERDALRALAHDLELVTEGFFNAWTRKEAYLKATGHGITRGLHHFDVSLAPSLRAELLADRMEPRALEHWRLETIAVPADYSAALVVGRGVNDVRVYDFA